MVVGALLLVALLATATAISHFWWDFFRLRLHPWLVINATLLGAYRSVIAFIAFPVVIVGGLYTGQQLLQRLERPEVRLSFANPKGHASISVWNASQTVVHDPKYWVVLLDIDDPESRQPLPIPTRVGDYIRVRGRWGPNAMISIPSVASRVKAAHRLVGWASATCPDCPVRHYWVFIKHGESGWYSEVGGGGAPDLGKLFAISDKPEEFAKAVFDSAPEARRVPMLGAYSKEERPR